MKTGELNRIAMYVCALVMGVCALCAGQDVFGAEDANGPVVADPNAMWDPATHLSAHWTSVSLTSRIDSPDRSPDPCGVQPALEYSRSLSIFGEVSIIDSNGLIAFTSVVADAFAADEDGREIPNDSGSFPMRMYRPLHLEPAPSGLATGLRPYPFSISMPMDPNAGYPKLVSRVEWSMYALVASRYEFIEMPFKATEKWLQILPGLEILVEQASAQGNKYQYRVQARVDDRQVAWLSGGSVVLREGDELPDRLMLEIEILNAERKPVAGGSGGFSTSTTGSGSGDERTYTTTLSGTCSDCGTATMVRYHFVVDPYEQEVRFILRDIPVPTF
jgi:hypothetical protein